MDNGETLGLSEPEKHYIDASFASGEKRPRSPPVYTHCLRSTHKTLECCHRITCKRCGGARHVAANYLMEMPDHFNEKEIDRRCEMEESWKRRLGTLKNILSWRQRLGFQSKQKPYNLNFLDPAFHIRYCRKHSN